MEDNAKLIEPLLEKATEYGKTCLELYKLKVIDKVSDVASSLIPHSVILILISCFMLFLNLGLSFWIGDLLGKTYYGFLVISAFYALAGIVMHFFMHKRLKRVIQNYIIKQILK
jgi:hypothetical protein